MKKAIEIPFIIIFDIGLFIFHLVNFIRSVLHFSLKPEPLVYNIVSNSLTFISTALMLCVLVHSLYTRYKRRACQVVPQGSDTESTTMTMEDIEDSPQILHQEVVTDENLEELEIGAIKKLASKLGKELLIYPTIICSLYGFINEKSWQFSNTLGGYNSLSFLYNTYVDALYTKLGYIWQVQKVIVTSSYNVEDNCRIKLKECLLPSLLVTPHLFLFALIHWLIMAITGVRIYVDNFSKEISQGNTSDTGDYKVAPYTEYMIFCGFYLPLTSVIVHIVLNRTWLSDEIESCLEKTFYFLVDPMAYIAVLFLMAPFIAFCVGIFLPDYDSSEFEVDSNAEDAATVLGVVFIFTFLICNIKATVIFAIKVIIIPIIFGIMITKALYYCFMNIHSKCKDRKRFMNWNR